MYDLVESPAAPAAPAPAPAPSEPTANERYEANVGLVFKVVTDTFGRLDSSKFAECGEIDDLYQEARVALLRAAHDYKPAKGSFSHYAYQIIRYAVLMWFRRNTVVVAPQRYPEGVDPAKVRRPISLSSSVFDSNGEETGGTYQALLVARPDVNTEQSYDEDALSPYLRELVERLPRRQKDAIYALVRGHTLASYGVQSEQLTKALEKLKKWIEEDKTRGK